MSFAIQGPKKHSSGSMMGHWPIDSFTAMGKNQTWTNRVVWKPDELHVAQDRSSDPAAG